jgi:hypothetical protein
LPNDRQVLRSLRTGSVTACAEDRLLAIAKGKAGVTGDPGLMWAVRLFVREQERQNKLICGALGEPGPWKAAIVRAVLDHLDLDLVLLLLSCRARVMSTVLTALRDRTESAYMRELSGRLAGEQIAQVSFASYLSDRMRTESTAYDGAGIESARRLLTIAIACRFWIRQRSRLRESGQGFLSFIGSLLDKPLLRETAPVRPL